MICTIPTTRRQFCAGAMVAATTLASPRLHAAGRFQLRYVLASAMYGTALLTEILPEVRKVGARHIDIWPAPHGNQREQIDEMGADRFATLLDEHDVHLGVLSSYRSGPFGLKPEMALAHRLGAEEVVLICGAGGARDAMGDELKAAVRDFVEKMKPHVSLAEKHRCVIAIENHSHSLIHTPDSMKWFAQFAADMPRMGLAFAPHHLPQDAAMQARLIEQLGPAIAFFYAQQHGKGSRQAMAKKDELLQIPGRGPLDFCPLLTALRNIDFTGFSEIFMHPYPRGVPILETTEAITDEINRSREYLEACLEKISK